MINIVFRHDACINRLRLRYIEFLEEQRDREERNNKLRGALDKVDNHLALITAKSNRLNALRVSFTAYLTLQLTIKRRTRECCQKSILSFTQIRTACWLWKYILKTLNNSRLHAKCIRPLPILIKTKLNFCLF